MKIFRILGTLCAGVLTYGLTTTLAVGAMLYAPINDGTTWTFRITEQWTDSDGNSGSSGPTIEQIQFAGIDYQVIDHRATLVVRDGSLTPPTYGKGYVMETANGYFIVSDSNPNNNQWYEYYIDPAPALTRDDLAVGQSVYYSGQWRGQWEIPGGGYQAWTGNWDETITNLGIEEVTTPLGTFQAMKFSNITNDTKSPNASHTSQSTQTSFFWMVDGIGIVKNTENWHDQSDFNGDNITDWWEKRDVVREVVPVPAAAWLFGSGLLVLIGVASGKKRRKK